MGLRDAVKSDALLQVEELDGKMIRTSVRTSELHSRTQLPKILHVRGLVISRTEITPCLNGRTPQTRHLLCSSQHTSSDLSAQYLVLLITIDMDGEIPVVAWRKHHEKFKLDPRFPS